MNDRQSRLDPSAARGKRLLFVTGSLAYEAVSRVVDAASKQYRFEYSIAKLPITVAALMTGKWVLKHLRIDLPIDFVVVPGHLREDAATIAETTGVPVLIGPKDIRDLNELFGAAAASEYDGSYRIEVIAEINHAPRLSIDELVSQALALRGQGADVIDIGCDPATRWQGVGEAIESLREKNVRCSIDTFDIWEAERATRSGAELVLSVNQSNREAAIDWGAEVVVVPDGDADWIASIDATVEYLAASNVRFRIDPILDPIGCGFAGSIERYREVRRRYPQADTMMGIGNVTELADVDSAGVNVVLLAICEELGVSSVLTTQVINWARSSVRECDIARRLAHFAVEHRLPPKRIDPRLVMLRDPKLAYHPPDYLESLSATIRDNNYRIFVDASQIHLISAGIHIRGTDPFAMIEELMLLPQSDNVDPSHAFYLGFELHKALTALQLGKRYEQDVALSWGMLTGQQEHRRLKRTYRRRAT